MQRKNIGALCSSVKREHNDFCVWQIIPDSHFRSFPGISFPSPLVAVKNDILPALIVGSNFLWQNIFFTSLSPRLFSISDSIVRVSKDQFGIFQVSECILLPEPSMYFPAVRICGIIRKNIMIIMCIRYEICFFNIINAFILSISYFLQSAEKLAVIIRFFGIIQIICDFPV